MKTLEKVSDFVGKYMAAIVIVVAAGALFFPGPFSVVKTSWVNTLLVLTTLNGPGKNRAPAATTMTMAAMYLPTKSLTFSRVFMLIRPFFSAFPRGGRCHRR